MAAASFQHSLLRGASLRNVRLKKSSTNNLPLSKSRASGVLKTQGMLSKRVDSSLRTRLVKAGQQGLGAKLQALLQMWDEAVRSLASATGFFTEVKYTLEDLLRVENSPVHAEYALFCRDQTIQQLTRDLQREQMLYTSLLAKQKRLSLENVRLVKEAQESFRTVWRWESLFQGHRKTDKEFSVADLFSKMVEQQNELTTLTQTVEQLKQNEQRLLRLVKLQKQANVKEDCKHLVPVDEPFSLPRQSQETAEHDDAGLSSQSLSFDSIPRGNLPRLPIKICGEPRLPP